MLLVRHKGLLLGSVEDGISLGVTRDMPVIVEKETHLSRMSGLIRYHSMTQKDVVMEIHDIAEDQLEVQGRMKECHVGHERLLDIEEFTFPLRCIKPGKLPIDPDPGVGERESNFLLYIGDVDAGMQFLTNMRPVNIPEIVVLIKTQQEFSIP